IHIFLSLIFAGCGSNSEGEKDDLLTSAVKNLGIPAMKLAAEFGYTDAEYYLGICYACDWGVDKDYNLAEKWLNKAAKNGDIMATRDVRGVGMLRALETKTDIKESDRKGIEVIRFLIMSDAALKLAEQGGSMFEGVLKEQGFEVEGGLREARKKLDEAWGKLDKILAEDEEEDKDVGNSHAEERENLI
ncbi:SEL1-like repeat protein, partial [bacterium]|nr:SEL1-like repeat protein [bacterium]